MMTDLQKKRALEVAGLLQPLTLKYLEIIREAKTSSYKSKSYFRNRCNLEIRCSVGRVIKYYGSFTAPGPVQIEIFHKEVLVFRMELFASIFQIVDGDEISLKSKITECKDGVWYDLLKNQLPSIKRQL